MKASFLSILFSTRSVIAALWVLILLTFSSPWISIWSALSFLPGLAIRFWAAGFIGPTSRKPYIATDHLVTRGPYSFSRHPLYIGNALLVAAGLILLQPHWILIVLTSVGFVTLYILLGIAEERKLSERYGEEYAVYRRKVTPLYPKRFEALLFKGFNPSWALRESNTWLVVGLLYLFAFLRAEVVPLFLKTSHALSLLLKFDILKVIAKVLLFVLG